MNNFMKKYMLLCIGIILSSGSVATLNARYYRDRYYDGYYYRPSRTADRAAAASIGIGAGANLIGGAVESRNVRRARKAADRARIEEDRRLAAIEDENARLRNENERLRHRRSRHHHYRGRDRYYTQPVVERPMVRPAVIVEN